MESDLRSTFPHPEDPVAGETPLIYSRAAVRLRAALVLAAVLGAAITGCATSSVSPATAPDSQGARQAEHAALAEPTGEAPRSEEPTAASEAANAEQGLDHEHDDLGHDDEGELDDGHADPSVDDDGADWQTLTASARCHAGLDHATCPLANARSPLQDLSESEIRRRLRDDPASLGPLSIGAASRGRLLNGVRMPEGERWTLTDPSHAWGTPETVESLMRAIDRVHAVHPDTRALVIGHLSAKGGGRLRPHKSHQSGRDVDLGYYYADPSKGWYAVANAKNLDRARTWTLVKALLESGTVEMILIDTSLQKILRDHALSAGEDPAFVDDVFQISGKSRFPLIRHAKGHATHLHVRFFSPIAQASAKIASPFLPKPPPVAEELAASQGKSHKPGVKPGQPGSEPPKASYILHRARSGDTLDSLARRYGTTVEAIKQANGLTKNAIKQKHTYKIPKPAPRAEAKPAGGATSNTRSRARK
jgi:LysM repeat protein